MPRKARQKSRTGIYHIMVRGVNRHQIFKDDGDRNKFINIINQTKEKSLFELYGYCLMGNHIHLLLREVEESISLIMQRICSSFAIWYNWKYDRVGHLFQERYKSEAVDSEAYLITVLRYIHHNPVKAGIVNSAVEYKWGSYNEHVTDKTIIDTNFILQLFGLEQHIAKEKFKIHTNELNEDKCFDYEEKHRVNDNELVKLIEEKYGIKKGFFYLLEREDMNRIIKNLKSEKGITIRQIARVTGVSKNIIEKA